MLPWFLPGVAISVAVSLAASGAVGRVLGVRQAVAWAVLLSLGIIMAATLTPQSAALGSGARGPAYCDFSRIGLAPWEQLLSANESSGNVLMFIPLGAAIGLVPRSRRKAAIVVGALALPFVIETTQLAVPWLDRACESADVVDNLTGLVLGLVAGSAAGWIVRGVGRQRR
jgi:glycopeptide antibiotics resistance protein